MLRFGTVVMAIAVGVAGQCSPVHALSAREILDEAKALDDTTRHWTDRTEKMTLHIYGKRGGERRRDLEVLDKRYPGDEDKSILFFLSPPEVKGTGFLQWAHKGRDDDQWLYLPELKRTRKITARVRDQSFMGTDFSYRDLEILGEIQDWTEEEAPTKLVGEETVDGHACHVIEFHPKQEGTTYSRIVMWMDKAKLVARKMDYYDDKDGKHEKTLSLTDIRDIGPIPTAHRMEMRNLKEGSRTVAELAEVAHDVGLSDDLFTQRHLERGGR
jgi:Outer membrane lipoprotein-sorting protein